MARRNSLNHKTTSSKTFTHVDHADFEFGAPAFSSNVSSSSSSMLSSRNIVNQWSRFAKSGEKWEDY